MGQNLNRPERIGDYHILDTLGEGGMATVFLAERRREKNFVKRFALKVVRPHLSEDPTFKGMFVREARIGSSLAHANIVSTIDFGTSDDQLYLVMEYVGGPTLDLILYYLKEVGADIPLDVALQICHGICLGLEHAHQARDIDGQPLKLVHRDLKPSNIFLDRDGLVKISDFGIARLDIQAPSGATGMKTLAGQVKGTVRYMAPEQAFGDPVDLRADLFSLGAILYELITLTPLYTADQESRLLREAQDAAVGPRLEALPNTSSNQRVRPLLADLLRRSPDDRCPSAGVVAERIEALQTALPSEERLTLRYWLRTLIKDSELRTGSRWLADFWQSRRQGSTGPNSGSFVKTPFPREPSDERHHALISVEDSSDAETLKKALPSSDLSQMVNATFGLKPDVEDAVPERQSTNPSLPTVRRPVPPTLAGAHPICEDMRPKVGSSPAEALGREPLRAPEADSALAGWDPGRTPGTAASEPALRQPKTPNPPPALPGAHFQEPIGHEAAASGKEESPQEWAAHSSGDDTRAPMRAGSSSLERPDTAVEGLEEPTGELPKSAEAITSPHRWADEAIPTARNAESGEQTQELPRIKDATINRHPEADTSYRNTVPVVQQPLVALDIGAAAGGGTGRPRREWIIGGALVIILLSVSVGAIRAFMTSTDKNGTSSRVARVEKIPVDEQAPIIEPKEEGIRPLDKGERNPTGPGEVLPSDNSSSEKRGERAATAVHKVELEGTGQKVIGNDSSRKRKTSKTPTKRVQKTGIGKSGSRPTPAHPVVPKVVDWPPIPLESPSPRSPSDPGNMPVPMPAPANQARISIAALPQYSVTVDGISSGEARLAAGDHVILVEEPGSKRLLQFQIPVRESERLECEVMPKKGYVLCLVAEEAL